MSSENRESKYKRCCTCDFWVTQQDRRCPNCGTPEPRIDRVETLTAEPPMTDGTRAAFGGFIGAIVGGFLMDGGMGVAVGVAVGVSLGVLLGADKEWPTVESAASLMGRRNIPCLKQTEATIQRRLSDIITREKRLSEARQRVEQESEGDLERWEKVYIALDSASGILARQRDRYHAKLWEITLVRWQNTLEPLAADLDRLTHEECNQRLRFLTIATDRGNAFLREWEGIDLTELPDGQRCVDRLKTALAACQLLKEALIVQQAALAVRGIAPVDDALHAVNLSGDGLNKLDIFNARAALGDFSSAFSELESEYLRLKSEDELTEGVLMVQRAR